MPDRKTIGRLAAAGLAATLAATSFAVAGSGSGHTTVFNPGQEAIFPVTSTIVSGPHEAMLVDAQFQSSYADELVPMIRSTGRS